MNYFYTDANGQKQGPIDDQQLQALATQGAITPESPLETDTGLKGTAGQIPSLKFATPAAPFNPFTSAMPQAEQIPGLKFAAAPSSANVGQVCSRMTSAATHTNSQNTSIVFERKITFSNLSNGATFMKFGVLIDGVEIGVIGQGRTEFSVAPGKHVLELKAQIRTLAGKVLGSKDVDFTISEGEQVAFFVRGCGDYGAFDWKTWTGVADMQRFYCGVFKPNDFIIVERR